MKALVYTAPNEMTLQERPLPDLHAGEVVLKIDAAGICGSDMHAYHGHDPRRKPGLVLGHELAATVTESASDSIGVGQRVTVNPLITCGVCQYCMQGRDNLCSNRGMVGMSRAGAFAQFMSVPAKSVVPIPDDMSPVVAALTEPAATVLHAINLAMGKMHRPLPEARVLVIGGGAIGLLTAILLRAYGCRLVDLAETNALRRASAEQHAGCVSIDPVAHAPAHDSYDFVVDAVGAAPTRNTAFNCVRPGGTILHIGLQDWSSEIDMRKLTLSEVTLLGTYTYTMADMYATVNALHNGTFGDLSWVETRTLEEGVAAFTGLDRGSIASGKVVLLPH
ncbi:galactitol-1-phosphate 5-dehydrogenase [Advenella sp. S44]|uniref:galactitol-1-phosphate 5-dehydrogenase n=1 Tax=Advenella sp. S44 TaxID=1982755 RepID=UPI000C29A862|nr:galactitol-1-phosphate 5-dehydrogenase [Advenella sp. S44]PJX22465.1 galactitol-1-phosphate 5-dehydrogenase [Advenella sp. S44]